MLMKAAARVVSFQRNTKTPYQTNLVMKEIAEEVNKWPCRHLICEQKATWSVIGRSFKGWNLSTRYKYAERTE
jgi:hypothetical protein